MHVHCTVYSYTYFILAAFFLRTSQYFVCQSQNMPSPQAGNIGMPNWFINFDIGELLTNLCRGWPKTPASERDASEHNASERNASERNASGSSSGARSKRRTNRRGNRNQLFKLCCSYLYMFVILLLFLVIIKFGNFIFSACLHV